jgi:hypothetical protein
MTDPLVDESRTDGTHDRSRLTWVVAAVAAVLIAGGVFFAVARSDGDPPPPPGGAASSGGAEGPDATDGEDTVTELTVGAAGASGRCRPPEASRDVVAQQTTVLDGTVESISGSLVTLVPARFYAGEPTDVVVVQAPGPGMDALLSAVEFEEGKRYLVSATDGQVTLCGFTAEYTEQLAAVYAEAFPGR